MNRVRGWRELGFAREDSAQVLDQIRFAFEVPEDSWKMNPILPEEPINRGIHGCATQILGAFGQILAKPLTQIGLAPRAFMQIPGKLTAVRGRSEVYYKALHLFQAEIVQCDVGTDIEGRDAWIGDHLSRIDSPGEDDGGVLTMTAVDAADGSKEPGCAIPRNGSDVVEGDDQTTIAEFRSLGDRYEKLEPSGATRRHRYHLFSTFQAEFLE